MFMQTKGPNHVLTLALSSLQSICLEKPAWSQRATANVHSSQIPHNITYNTYSHVAVPHCGRQPCDGSCQGSEHKTFAAAVKALTQLTCKCCYTDSFPFSNLGTQWTSHVPPDTLLPARCHCLQFSTAHHHGLNHQ